jgi:hypothetical protein
MVVEFDNSLDDLLALNLYHHQQSSSAQRTRRLLQFGPAAVLVIAFLVQVLISGASPVSSLPWLLFAAVWTAFVPYLMRRSLRKRILQLYAEGRDRGIVGRHTLSLTATGVTDKTSFGKTVTTWREVRKAVATHEYVFIYVSDTVAHIVPRRAFPDQTGFHEFRDTVFRHMRAAGGG